MRIVRDRADARWLPSRFNFALFRLFAWLRLRASRPEPRPGLMLAIERHQSEAENYTVSIVMIAVLASFFRSFWGIPVAIVVVQAAIVASGLITHAFRGRDADTTHGSGAIIMGVTIALAVWFARTAIVPRVFLALVVLNAIAAVIMFALRRKVAAVEAKYL